MNYQKNADDGVNNNKPFKKNAAFRVYSAFKRTLDLICAVLALIVAALPMLMIAALILADSPGPVIFVQKRVGKHGELFDCYKFRTMSVKAPKSCASAELKNAECLITRTGRILRKTSLDELPQLINILKGNMSFIGPRPLIPEEEYIHKERLSRGIYNLRPGISGYAQINGRDWVTPEQKVDMDEYYLRHFSFSFDVSLFFGTILSVLKKEGIHEGQIDAGSEAE